MIVLGFEDRKGKLEKGDKREPEVLIYQGRNPLVTSKTDKSRNRGIRILFRDIEARMRKKIARRVEGGVLWEWEWQVHRGKTGTKSLFLKP